MVRNDRLLRSRPSTSVRALHVLQALPGWIQLPNQFMASRPAPVAKRSVAEERDAMKMREKAIRRAAEKAGVTIEWITWEPIGIAMEMCGPSGGWAVSTGGDVLVAYHYKEIIEQLTEMAPRRAKKKGTL